MSIGAANIDGREHLTCASVARRHKRPGMKLTVKVRPERPYTTAEAVELYPSGSIAISVVATDIGKQSVLRKVDAALSAIRGTL